MFTASGERSSPLRYGLGVRGTPVPVPLYPLHPRSFNLRNRHCRACCSFHSPPAGRFALRASAHWAHASLRCPFRRWGPAGPPSPNLGVCWILTIHETWIVPPSVRLSQQDETMMTVPLDGMCGVGWGYRPHYFQPVSMVCKAFSIESGDHPFPAAKPRGTHPAT